MQQSVVCSGQVRAQRAMWRSGWRLLLVLLLMVGAVGQSWACTSPINFTVASGGTYTFTCDPIGFISPPVSSPTYGTVVFAAVPTNSNYLEYVNNGSGSSDTFIVKDSNGIPITFNATITGSVSPITVSPATLPTPTVGVAYSQTLTATGGTGSYTYSVGSGSLPPGLSLSPGGVVSGTSTGSGYYAFIVHVVDSTTPTAQTVDKSYAFTIPNPTLTISPSSPPTGTVGQPYSVQFSTSGGTSPYTYSTGSALPAGLTLSSGGLLSGTPTTAGSTTISLQSVSSTSISSGGHVSATLSVTLNMAAVTVPGAPTIGTATAGNTQASVTFTAPASDGGAAITGYTATSSPGGLTGSCTSSPCTVTGLTNGTAYTFTVTATNSAGTGTASAASNSVTPKAPQTITFGNPGAQNFGTTPTLGATASSGLAVSFSSTTTGVCTVTGGGALTFVTAGTCSINADQSGDGTYLAAPTVSQSFTVNAVVPGAPTIGTATAGDTQATVSFTAPASNGGATITGYTVTSSPGGFTGSGTGSPITVTGLTNGIAYTFMVTATNSAGTGTASAASNSVTPKSAQTITFTNPGAQNFGTTPTLSATASSGLAVSFSSTTTGVCTVTSGGALTFVTAGTCSINADQSGNSAYLVASTVSQSFAVNAVAPGAPTIGTATAGDTQATVSFTAPASNGGATITGYTVTSNPGGFTGSGAASPITVTGLTNGIAYTFTVTATNSAGTGTASTASNSVTPLPPKPIANPVSATVAYDSSSNAITLNITGGTPTSVAVATLASHGTATASGTSITYTPTSGFAGSDSFTYTATNSAGTSAAATVSITVPNPTLTVTPSGSMAATAGQPYTQTFTFSGGAAPYSGDAVTGLPAGLSITGSTSSSVTVSGTPTASGSFPLSVSAADSSTGNGPFTVNQSFTLTSSTATLSLSPASLPSATVGGPYSQAISATGGVAPYTFTVTTGALPAGLSLSSSGVLSGTSIAGGSFNFSVMVTDSSTGTGSPATATKSYTLTVAAATIALTPATLPNALQGSAYSQNLGASGGTGPYVFAVTAGSLPAGMSLTSGGGLSGTPTAAGNYGFTITATDSSTGTGPYTGSQAYAFSVTANPPTVANDTATTASQQAVTIAVTANDSGTISSIAVASGPSHGTASVSGTSVVYTPTGTFFGTDTFTYTATGPGGTSPPTTVTVTVTALAVPAAGTLSATVLAGKSVTLDATQGASGGPFTSAQVVTAPGTGTVTVSGTQLVYNAPATASGSVSFTYTLSNAYGTSAPATATVQVNAIPRPVALKADAIAGQTVQVDLTGPASGGPFTAAALVSIAPSNAGSGSIVQTANGYRLDFTAASSFSGVAQVAFTLSNAYATSAPTMVSIQVTARPDPTKDSEVIGILAAQNAAVRRFATGQLDNFSRRLEALHAGGTGRFSNGLTFMSGRGWRTRNDPFNPGYDANPDQFDQRYFMQPDDPHAAPAGKSPTAADKGVAFWTGGAVNFGTQKLGGSHNGIDFTTAGISVGADTRISPALAVGGGIGYGHDSSDVGQAGSRVTSDAYTAAAYASYHPGGALYVDGVLGYQSLSLDSRRYVTADGATVNGKRDGHQTFGSLALGYEHHDGGLTVAPYGRLDLARATLDKYTEIGDALYALSYDRQTVTTTTGSLGLRLSKVMQRDFGTLAPLLRVEYRHDFQGDSSATLRYADLPAGPLYRTNVGMQSRNHTLLGLGLQAQTTHGFTFRVEYQSLFESSSRNNQSIELGLECPFDP